MKKRETNLQEELPPRLPARSEKGERSRQAILTAAIECIACDGLNGTSHRKIAARAGVPHSLTTYFFSSLDDLLEQAYEFFLASWADETQQLLRDASNYLAGLDPVKRFDPAHRSQVIEHLSTLMVSFIRKETSANTVGIAVQLNILYTHRKGSRLQQMAKAYRSRLIQQIVGVILKLAPERSAADAKTDASLILSLLNKLERDCFYQQENPPLTQMHAEMHRMLRLMFAISETDAANQPDSPVNRSTAT